MSTKTIKKTTKVAKTTKKRFSIRNKLAPGTRVMVTKSTRRTGEFGTVSDRKDPPPSSPPLSIPVRFKDGYVRWYHPTQLTLVASTAEQSPRSRSGGSARA